MATTTGWTPWLSAGDLSVRFREDPTGSKNTTRLVKETAQWNRDDILSDVREKAKEASLGNKPRNLSHGRFLGTVPLIDFLKLQKTDPELFSPDREIARKALISFWNSGRAEQYRIQRA